jgi:5-methylcytosine-specific restriction enzyme subunit McrC
MKPNLSHEATLIPVVLTEWDKVGPPEDVRLRGVTLKENRVAQEQVKALQRRVNFREGYEGLEIETTSFVGRIDFERFRCAIQPKLPAMPLSVLLRYAYGLRDVSTIDETRTSTAHHGLHDLLIVMLADEVEELLHRGLSRRYVSASEKLASPRGRVQIAELARRGGVIEARLPCTHFERRVNWQLNQVLRAGLDLACGMTEQASLRRRLYRLSDLFGGVDRITRLEIGHIDQAERAITRLTSANAGALTIVRLLANMQGISSDSAIGSVRTPGFLFDMNTFFQRLLSRFLRENLTTHKLQDEWAIRDVFAYSKNANPKQRKPPRPRPDYALLNHGQVRGFLDAKYRDVWGKGLPPDWLYQLSIYALAAPCKVSVLLYATMAADARDEQIEVHQPMVWSTQGPAFVILRPVLLPRLAELLRLDQKYMLGRERSRFANSLVNLKVR